MQAPDDYYADETPEWEDLMRMLDANNYEYDASGSIDDTNGDERTDYIDLHTPGGRYPTIKQTLDGEGQSIGWTITFDFEENEEPRTYSVRTIGELIDLIEAN